MSRLMLFVLVVMLQACMTTSVPTESPEETAGILERAKQKYRETKAKVLNVGSTVSPIFLE